MLVTTGAPMLCLLRVCGMWRATGIEDVGAGWGDVGGFGSSKCTFFPDFQDGLLPSACHVQRPWQWDDLAPADRASPAAGLRATDPLLTAINPSLTALDPLLGVGANQLTQSTAEDTTPGAQFIANAITKTHVPRVLERSLLVLRHFCDFRAIKITKPLLQR